MTDEECAEACRRIGTGQCAPICLSHSSLFTSNGTCPSRRDVHDPFTRERNRMDRSLAAALQARFCK